MPVHLLHVPAKGAPFGSQGFQIHHLLQWAIYLEFVVVNDGGEVVQIVYKPRTKEREILGVAHIISKEYGKVEEITEDEAKRDGFSSALEMWLWLKKPNGNDLIHKLTLRWVNG